MEEAMQLSPYAEKITILVRSSTLKAAHRMQDKISNYNKIGIVYNKELVEIGGNDQGVTTIKVRDNLTKEITDMQIDGVFLAIGRLPRNDLVINKLALDRFGYIHTDETLQSVSHQGIFAAGEVGNSTCSQAVEAASSGSIAANSASQFLRSIGVSDNVFKNLKDQIVMS